MNMIPDILLWFAVAVVVIFTLVPFLRISHGAVRSADFPRQQILFLALLTIVVAWMFGMPGWRWLLGLMVPCALIQLFYIGRYLPVWHTQSLEPRDGEDILAERSVSIIAANVKMSNRDYDKLIDLTRDVKPDILMALETDQDWVDGLASLREDFPHVAARPNDNGYGMIVFSRFPLEDSSFREKVVEKVPSFRARIPLGDLAFRLYVIHPEPPVPYQDTEGRDAEMAAIGIEARDDPLPVIVSGDLNDVAWSVTTKRFQNVSGLLDPRVGRGFYNTFSATIPIMRWPLDHLFHSAEFRLLDMKRLNKIGSDHFPMYFKLLLTSVKAAKTRPDDATDAEMDEVEDMIAREKSSDRTAIGSDWEDDA